MEQKNPPPTCKKLKAEQTGLYKKNASKKIPYMKQIFVRKTFKSNFIMTYQKQNLFEP